LTLVEVNNEISRGRFQEPFGEMIGLRPSNQDERKRLRGRREGEKRGTVGIQEEFQTERVEDL
jgi:hypothetical protein